MINIPRVAENVAARQRRWQEGHIWRKILAGGARAIMAYYTNTARYPAWRQKISGVTLVGLWRQIMECLQFETETG